MMDCSEEAPHGGNGASGSISGTVMGGNHHGRVHSSEMFRNDPQSHSQFETICKKPRPRWIGRGFHTKGGIAGNDHRYWHSTKPRRRAGICQQPKRCGEVCGEHLKNTAIPCSTTGLTGEGGIRTHEYAGSLSAPVF